MRSLRNHGGAPENNRGITGHVLNLHKRLYHALSLGSWENKEKWHSSDIEIQRLVLRSMDGFLDCISCHISQHSLIQDSVVDMVRTLKSILDFKSESILIMASNVAVKMVNILPSSMLQSHHVLDLICPLADLLASQQLQTAMSCTSALNIILSKLSFRDERLVLELLKETQAVSNLIHNVKQSCIGDKPIEYFQYNASVLSKILWRWSSSRFCVWNDFEFLNVLGAVKHVSENSMKVAVLQLYSSLGIHVVCDILEASNYIKLISNISLICWVCKCFFFPLPALCGNGADKLIENGEEPLHMMVCCMYSSNAHSVRMEAFKLARCLMLSKKGCLKVMNKCCEPFVKAIIDAMKDWSLPSEKLDKARIPIVEEACRLASITRWAGDHHSYFWKEGIDKLLVDLLLDDHHEIHQLYDEVSLNDLISIVGGIFSRQIQLSLRPYVWDILGGLAANCAENINHVMDGRELRLNVLIICACFSFINSLGTSQQISQNSLTNLTEGESAARAILMMVYSPCKYIASLARSVLCEVLQSTSTGYLEYLLHTLNARLSGNKFGLPGDLQVLVCLMSLACYCSLSKYRKLIIKYQGLKIMIVFIRWWLNNPIYCKRASVVPHLKDPFTMRSCCFPSTEEWDGDDMFLFFSLRILAELLQHSSCVKVHPFDNKSDFDEVQLIQDLQDISDRYSPGSKWYAAYVLSSFGLWGFPTKRGKSIGKLLGENEHSDLKLELVNQDVVYVHEVILLVRCPALLPPVNEKSSCGSTFEKDSERNTMRVVRLSDRVDHEPLMKLLQYVYLGYLQAIGDIDKRLKIFARHCKLEALLQILSRTHPKWGTPIPSFDFSPALGPAGVNLSDLLLEADTPQLLNWKCNICSDLVPHRHVHKVILETSCDYLRALLQSGMRESNLQTIKVPVSWESLNKLISWFYSDQLPKPTFDCSWNYLDLEVKCQEVESLIELCWLAEYWLIEDLQGECYKVVVSCLTSSTDLSTKMIQVAANFSQCDLVQVAANSMAPSYHRLRNSGELDALDDNIVEMIRVASVRLSQESTRHSC